LQMSPEDSKRLLESADTVEPADPQALAFVRQQYIDEAEPLGSVPMPATIKGIALTGAQLLTGKHPQLFLDKLAERLAFERGGTRIYDALITKFTAADTVDSIVTLQELMEIRNDEASHFFLLSETIRAMGGDPTSQTPSADLVGVETMGVIQVVSDPRTTFVESLHAVLTAELTDVAGWELLVTLADMIGESQTAERFRVALDEENEHLANVKQWHQQLTLQPIS
jgi:bacterioferritin (cytochrome b1)